nr:hypothetical protein [Brevundimonas diminuta]
MSVDAVDTLIHDLHVVADEPVAGAAADGDAENGDGADESGPRCQFDQIQSPSCPAQLRGMLRAAPVSVAKRRSKDARRSEKVQLDCKKISTIGVFAVLRRFMVWLVGAIFLTCWDGHCRISKGEENLLKALVFAAADNYQAHDGKAWGAFG